MSQLPANASPDASSPGSGPHAPAHHSQAFVLQQQQLLQQLQAQQPPPQLAAAPTLDINTLALLLQHQQAAMQQQQLQATAQLLSLQALGPLATFSGKDAAAGLAAIQWLQQAERYFAARETALGISSAQGDASRVTLAANALQDGALTWYNGLPAAARPTTWAAFCDALRGRYGGNVPAARVRIEQLRNFVDAARRLRDKMTLEGLQAYTARFQPLAGEIPDTHLTAHGKLELLARGLAPRLAEVVLTEDANDAPAALHEVIRKVLAKATFKEYAAGQGSASYAAASSSSSAPMQLDAIALCATQFGISRDDAARYLEPQEGWVPHETGSAPSSAASSYPPPSSGHRRAAKLTARFVGPFKVTRVINDNAYELALPPQLRIHPVQNVSKLRRYRRSPAAFDGRPQPVDRPPPDCIDPAGDAEWHVERILAQRRNGRRMEYLVKWKGYPNEDSSWEPRANLRCPDLLAEFEEQQLLAALSAGA